MRQKAVSDVKSVATLEGTLSSVFLVNTCNHSLVKLRCVFGKESFVDQSLNPYLMSSKIQ